MMQSLLITRVTGPQNSDVKANKGIENPSVLAGQSEGEEITQEGASFAKVMQESLDKNNKKMQLKEASNTDKVSESKDENASPLLTELSEDVLIENEIGNSDLLATTEMESADLIDPQVMLPITEVDETISSEITVEQIVLTVNNQMDVEKNEATKVDSLIKENETIASSVEKNETNPSIEATKVVSAAMESVTATSAEATKIASVAMESETATSSTEATEIAFAAMESETATSSIEATEIAFAAMESETATSSIEENEATNLIEITNSTDKYQITKSNEEIEVIKSIQKNDTIKSVEESEIVKSTEEKTLSTEQFINAQPLQATSNVSTEQEKMPVNTEVDLLSEADDFEQTQLLSQIEAAQEVDVSVKMSANDASKVITTAASLSANTQAVKETLVESFNNNSKNEINNKNESNDESIKLTSLASAEKGQQSLTEDISKITPLVSGVDHSDTSKIEAALQAISGSDHVDSLSATVKNEGVMTTQSIADVNGLKPSQTSALQLDRVLTGNQQTQTMNNSLQEPLDIQSKQAATMMGERVMMMISQGKQEVNIRLDPAELGSMHIKIHVQQDQVQLHIQTQVGLSKEVIEQNMPRLREQLAQQGIQLGEANVEQQSQQQGQQQNNQQVGKANRQSVNGQEGIDEGQTAVWTQSKIASVDQGIDYYA